MTREQLLLTQLAEECAEVIKEVAKAIRFGPGEVMPGQPLTNADRIKREFVDLFQVWIMLCRDMVVLPLNEGDDPAFEAKRVKVEEYLEASRRCGVLETKPQPTE